jgi:hypothetical protein
LFKEQLETWKKLMEDNASYYDRIKQANLEDYINDGKKNI